MMSLLSADAMEMLAWLALEERKEEWILAVARLAASERSVTVDGTVDLDVPTAAPPSLSQHCALHRSRSGPQISPGPNPRPQILIRNVIRTPRRRCPEYAFNFLAYYVHGLQVIANPTV